MNLVTHAALNLAAHVIHELTIITFKEEDVIGSINETVAGDFLRELILHFFLDAEEEVAADLLVLVALHLGLNNLGHKNGVIESNLKKHQQRLLVSNHNAALQKKRSDFDD